MPRSTPAIPAFNAGEFDSKLAARVDLAKYPLSSARLENYDVLPQGGMTRRPGTHFVREVRDSTSRARLVPFEFSVDSADVFVIEAGPGYLRFFDSSRNIVTTEDIGATITNGTFDTDISGWTDASAGGSGTSFNAGGYLQFDVVGTDAAITEQTVATSTPNVEHTLQVTIRGLPGAIVRASIGPTAGDEDYFGRDLNAGFHTLSFTPTAGSFVIRFSSTSNLLPALDNVILLDDAPFELATPYTEDEVQVLYIAQSADVIYIASGTKPMYRLERRGTRDWSFIRPEFTDGPYDIENSDTTRTIQPNATTGNNVALTATGFAPFTDLWIGRLVRLRTTAVWGHAVITSIDSSTIARAVVLEDFEDTTATEQFIFGAFSDVTGYPRVVTFHEQRLALAGNRVFPQTFWLSQSADFNNFRPDSVVEGAIQIEDDDALDFTISADQVNTIVGMSSGRELIILTEGGEWTVRSSGAFLTPTDRDVKRQTTHGSAAIAPVRVGSAVLFLQRSRRKIRELLYNFGNDGFDADDVTILAEQVTRSGVERLAYQQEPYNYVHAQRTDGQLCTLAYLRSQDVNGWSRKILGGSFDGGIAQVESVVSVPGVAIAGERTQDDLWVIVKRTINGSTRRYVEVFSRIFEGLNTELFDTEDDFRDELIELQKLYVGSDSAVIYNGVETSTITGLDHLEGQDVVVWADGALQTSKTVTGGSIVLDLPAAIVVVGLAFEHVYKSFKFGVGTRTGSGINKVKRINAIGFIVDNTAALRVGQTGTVEEPIPLREVSDQMDTPAPLTTGEVRVLFPSSHIRDPRIIVSGSEPAPHTILGMALEMDSRDPA